MVQQAADAVLAAYGDGLARQSVRLNLDVVVPRWKVTEGGMEALLAGGMPLAKRFTQALAPADGAPMKGIRVSAIDDIGVMSGDVGALLYRESEVPSQDAAVVFLGGRNFAIEESTQTFLEGMKDRLVVALNSEDAASTFKLENKGLEFTLGGGVECIDELSRFCETFREETYYYRLKRVNDWTTLVFRAYPHPWEVHIESLAGEVVKIGESASKPTPGEVSAWSTAYEEANGISAADKRRV